MSDTWSDLQAFKNKQSSLRERLKKRREAVAGILDTEDSKPLIDIVKQEAAASSSDIKPVLSSTNLSSLASTLQASASETSLVSFEVKEQVSQEVVTNVEKRMLLSLNDPTLDFPVLAATIHQTVTKDFNEPVPVSIIADLLEKFAAQNLVILKKSKDSNTIVEQADHAKISAFSEELTEKTKPAARKRRRQDNESETHERAIAKHPKREDLQKKDDLIESLLSAKTAKESENQKLNDEILELLSKPTAKEQSVVEKFRSQGGTSLKEFCPHGTKTECRKMASDGRLCSRLHFRKIIHKHTDENLGDCSFLNTCFHMDTCKYVHYAVDYPEYSLKSVDVQPLKLKSSTAEKLVLFPPQWIQCDLRHFDMATLGKFSVIMADPPWDIHMELPYGTMQDDEMRKLSVPVLQDDGYIFLWVTGRAMELGRDCLQVWGYERVDELIWVKTNQLQRIIRTGRTGHWLNHGKEHCLIGVKGNPKNFNRGLDCDILVAEVRATSHKPDEVYGIIERLAPGSRKIELFGRPHNVQPNWITLGNQVDGVRLLDPDVVRAFRKKYPEPKLAMVPPDKAEQFLRTGKID